MTLPTHLLLRSYAEVRVVEITGRFSDRYHLKYGRSRIARNDPDIICECNSEKQARALLPAVTEIERCFRAAQSAAMAEANRATEQARSERDASLREIINGNV